MQLFGISNCSTVKKARDWLSAHHVSFGFHDFKKQGLNQALLEDWLNQQPWENLINRAGMTWRNASDAEKKAVVDAKSAMQFMLVKPSAIKRPVLVKGGKVIALGFSKEVYQTLLNPSQD